MFMLGVDIHSLDEMQPTANRNKPSMPVNEPVPQVFGVILIDPGKTGTILPLPEQRRKECLFLGKRETR